MNFEWDPRKAAGNKKKHGVSFSEAASAFGDPFSITVPDPLHSSEEERFILLGMTEQRRLVVVVHVERGENLCLISARSTTRQERQTYEEAG